MNAQHTPGPWTVEGRYTVTARGTMQDVAHVCYAGDTEAETDDANARLIAAAPELLDALRDMLAQVEDFHRATGHEEKGAVQCDALCALMPKARAAIAKAQGGAS